LNNKKKTVLLILIASLVRFVIAFSIELGNDEVYYRMYAQWLQWNYFDHPPMVGWLIRFTTANLFFDNELFIRLGAIISAAITTWILYLSGKKLQDEFTGFLAALIYTATIYGSIIAGTFILPDSPQMLCWSSSLYLLIGITANTTINRKKAIALVWFGFIAGLGMLCKIHSVFLWFGLLLYVIFYNRAWLKQPALYISGAITLLLFYPVIKWNIDNHFVTYLYHSKRVDVAGSGFNITTFLTFVAGQVFYFNPVIYPFLIAATVAAIKNKTLVLSAHKRLLLFTSLPLIVISTGISFFKTVLPHWTGPGYTGIILLTACYFSSIKPAAGLLKITLPKPLEIAISMLLSFIVCGILLINYYPGTLGKKDKQFTGEGDFTLDMYGWNSLKPAFEKILLSDIQSGKMKSDAVIISNNWFPAAHLDFYVAMPLKRDIIAIGDTSDIHQYAWLNHQRKKLHTGDDAYCIVPSDNYFNAKEKYASLFSRITEPFILEQKRNGKICRRFYVYRLNGYHSNKLLNE
jgi:hypothetical protein